MQFDFKFSCVDLKVGAWVAYLVELRN